MGIFILPPELLVAIIACLDVQDILAFCRICRLAHGILTNSIFLQYLVALSAAGMADEDVPSLGVRDRLAYLTRREALWNNIELGDDRRVVIPVDHRHSHIHALTAGIYIFGELSDVPDSIRTNSLRYAHLPTYTHQPKASSSAHLGHPDWWKYVPLGVEALNIGVSLEQNDLLVVLTSSTLPNTVDMHVFQLHLKRFSTMTYHPRAQQSIIEFHQYRNDMNNCIASIDIAGPHLLVLLTWLRAPNSPDELFVYDWTTGFLILHVSSDSFTYRGASFLSLDTFIITNMRENAIEFLRLKKNRVEEGLVECRWIGKLALPPLQRGSSIISVSSRTDAIRSQTPGEPGSNLDGQVLSISSGTSKKAIAPIHCAPHKAIVQFRMYLQGGGTPNIGHVSLFAFVAHRGELLSIIEMSCGGFGSTSPSEVATKPWDTWGPAFTRWSGTDETDTAWMAGVAGQRQIYITGDRPRRIHVRDYNAVTVKKELSKAVTKSRVVVEETVTAHQGCFATNVVSALPFVEVVTEQTFNYDGVSMDESHVIGLTEDEVDGSIRQLDVYMMFPDGPSPEDENI